MTDTSVRAVSDSELRRALLGTWRILSCQANVDGAVVNTFGDNPQGYLVYTPDGHVFVQIADPDRRALFVATRGRGSGPVLLETTEAGAGLGLICYSGMFEVQDGQAIHHTEFHVVPEHNGRVETRSVVLDGDRLILGTPWGALLEWQRVH
jgi:hypothetical protein